MFRVALMGGESMRKSAHGFFQTLPGASPLAIHLFVLAAAINDSCEYTLLSPVSLQIQRTRKVGIVYYRGMSGS